MATTEAATSAYAAATEAAAITKAAAVAEAGITARSEIGIIVEAIVVTALTETAVGTASAGIGIPVALRSAINISMRSINATRIVISLDAGKTAIAYMPNHRTTPVPRTIPATPAVIPWVIPATIPSCVAIIPRIIPRVEPWVIPARIIAVAPRIVPSPHARTPVVRTIAIVAVEPRIIIAIPAAHAAGVVEILILVDVFLGKIRIIIDAVGHHALAHMKLDDVVAQRIGAHMLKMTEDASATVILIHITPTATPIE